MKPINPELFIESNRLLIRPWRLDDIEAYLTLANDVGYIAFSLPGQFALDPETASDRIRDRIELFNTKKVGKFLLLSKETGSVIGTCGLGSYELDGQEEFELGYRIRLEHWGKGYATEAARSILEYGFDDLGVRRILAFALPQNQLSLRVVEKLGFLFLKTFLHANLPHRLYELKSAG